jgi:hypothetical protein
MFLMVRRGLLPSKNVTDPVMPLASNTRAHYTDVIAQAVARLEGANRPLESGA